MKKKAGSIIGIFSAVFFVLCILEGGFYYHTQSDSIYVRIMLNIQNAIKAFLMNSDIKIAHAAGELSDDISIIRRIIIYLYIAAVVFAPFCTIAAIMMTAKRLFYRLLVPIRQRSSKRAVVIGAGEEGCSLILSMVERYSVTYLYSGQLPDAAELKLLRKGVRCVHTESNRESSALFGKYKLNQAEYLVLSYEDASENFSVLCRVADYLKETKCEAPVVCCLFSSDYVMSEIIREYFDHAMEETPELRKKLELVLIDRYEIAVREMLRKKPVYSYQEKLDAKMLMDAVYDHGGERNPWDVHMVIAGFGGFGQELLLEALDQGVLQADATIYIDVFDNRICELLGIFLKRFSDSVVEGLKRNEEVGGCRADYSLCLPLNGSMDGRAVLRFFAQDVRSIDFEHTLCMISEGNPITYAAVCISSHSLAMVSLLSLEKILRKYDNPTAPVLLRIDSGDGAARRYVNAVTVGSRRSFSFDALVRAAQDEAAMEFNYHYNNTDITRTDDWFRSMETDPAEVRAAWDKMPVFKRESSTALSVHRPMKEFLLSVYDKNGIPYSQQLERLKELCSRKTTEEFVEALNADPLLREMAAMEHRRWCQFMISHGYDYAPGRKNDLLKTNPCLLSWEELCEKLPEYCMYDLTMYVMILAGQGRREL